MRARQRPPRAARHGGGKGGPSSSRGGDANGSRSGGGGGGTKKPSAWSCQKGERITVGIHSVREALKVRPQAIRLLGLRDDYLRAPQLKEIHLMAEAARVPIRTVPSGELEGLVSGHQGAVAVVTESPAIDRDRLWAQESCVVMACDGLEDPANLGSVLRSAWLMGVQAILIPQDRAVGVTTAASKVASGGAEHVPVEAVSNLPRELEDWKKAGFWIFGLAEAGKAKIWDMKIPSKVVWVLGSESSGLRVTVERACDELVRLPQIEGGSSYNAAVSAAMALYETARQHSKLPTK